jgi:hypothetical protein
MQFSSDRIYRAPFLLSMSIFLISFILISSSLQIWKTNGGNPCPKGHMKTQVVLNPICIL